MAIGAKMTRKDFQLIADVLKRNHASRQNAGNRAGAFLIEELALDFAHSLKETNPRFNIERFVKAALKK